MYPRVPLLPFPLAHELRGHSAPRCLAHLAHFERPIARRPRLVVLYGLGERRIAHPPHRHDEEAHR